MSWKILNYTKLSCQNFNTPNREESRMSNIYEVLIDRGLDGEITTERHCVDAENISDVMVHFSEEIHDNEEIVSIRRVCFISMKLGSPY